MNRILHILFPLMKDILKKVDLYVESNQFPPKQKLMWKDLESYQKAWEKCYQNKLFHLRLKDHSLFRFLFTNESVSFVYLDSPYRLEEYIEIEDYNVVMFQSSDYEDRSPTPIRYDFEPVNFNELTHPVGHLHFGLENPIRIGTFFLFNPMSFLLFCIRQMYPKFWVKIIEIEKFVECQKHIRDVISEINEEYKIAYNREYFLR